MTVTATGKYTQFDDTPESTHNLVLSLVPPGSRVLEFGCATGYMSAVLRARLGCTVTGIEVNEEAAELARQHAQRVIVGDAESLDYNDVLGSERFDVIVFADVLEHLRHPRTVLWHVRPYLSEKGLVVASIPNIAHGSVRVALLGGDFRYTPKGLLDDSHLRFFTRESILALFEDAGYVIAEWLHKRIPIDQTEVVPPDTSLVESLKEPLQADPDATTYQFVVCARKAEDAEGLHPVRADLGALRADLDAREATIRVLQAQLAQQTEAMAQSTQLVAEREIAIGHLRQSLDNRDELRRDLTSLRKLLRQQSAHIDGLASKLAAGVVRQEQLEQSLEAAHQDLLRRDDAIHCTLYELQSTLRASSLPGGSSSDSQREYQQLIRRVQEIVRRAVPRGETVAVTTRGDDALLSLYGRTAWHFPQTADGVWAGEYPATGIGAIAQLETLRALGAGFLLFPKPAMWWLEHYAGLARHLNHRYRLVVRQDDTCVLYDMRQPVNVARQRPSVWQVFDQTVVACRARLGHDPAILDWHTQRDLATGFPLLTVFSPPSSRTAALPYIDNSIDIIALASDDPIMQAEARRVASVAVLTFSSSNELQVGWLDATHAQQSAAASISIIIPCFNQVSVTAACLRAIAETLPRDLDVEIVVVDDASTDETPRLLGSWAEHDDRRRVVRNPTNVGFVASCNRGAQAANGDLLVFLNNDTLPLPDWLEALVQIFSDRPDAGAVGARLLYPDGRLQEAGGVVFADGSAANVGRGEYDADQPLFNFVRVVDYCSGALLATPRLLFASIGGFDARYAPAYYEDADYCFAVRARGQRVYYQPRCVIVHREGVSSGTDLTSGVKRFQTLNQVKFARKWARALKGRARPPAKLDASAWYALAHSSWVERHA